MAKPPTADTDARDFLLEIGVEELPAAAARSALEQLGGLTLRLLEENRLEFTPGGINVWVTPRRIALFVAGLAAVQKAEEIAAKGPNADVAFDRNGKPTKAAEGFARAKGVQAGDLEVREKDGQRFVYAIERRMGKATGELLPGICSRLIKSLTFPRTMRWDGGDMRFSRPVRWLAAKYGNETIGFEAGGLQSGETSRGHRFLGSEVTISAAADYRELMAREKVIVDQEERRRLILEGLATEAARRGGRFIDPADELEEVIYLVEFPSVHSGSFDESHLRLPEKVLVTAMQSHQRYFPLTAEDGTLMDGFLYVMNGDNDCADEITEGNERVLEGRIDDAEFSFDKDVAAGIESMLDRLPGIVFHSRLGSLADKVGRLTNLTESFSATVGLDEAAKQAATTAAGLSKADQASVMVHEFPELEGYIGSVYANIDGYHADVCNALAEQYLPTAAGGDLPETLAGAVLSICDKVDNITGAFCVEEIPSGSRDPYGLRRAAAGIAEIANRFAFDYDLLKILRQSHRLYLEQGADIRRDENIARAAFTFICDRVQQRLVEKGMPVEVVGAARAAGSISTNRLIALAVALDTFRRDSRFEDLHTAYFRSTKITSKSGIKAEVPAVNESLFEEDAERELFQKLNDLEPRIAASVARGDYTEALATAATVRPAVDRFFDDVLVMAEDERLRLNRFALLQLAVNILKTLGDPVKVAAAP